MNNVSVELGGRQSIIKAKHPDAGGSKTPESGNPDFLETLARGLHVMTALGQYPNGTISDIARATNLPKPSVRRVLLTLCSLNYAQEDGRGYALTPRVTRFAAAYLGTCGKSRVLQTRCQRLSNECGQCVIAAVLDGEEQFNVAFAIPPNFVGIAQGVGSRQPAYRTAAGRLLLAHLPDAQLSKYLEHVVLEAATPLTIVDKKKLRAAILRARDQGYCEADGQAFLDFRTIAYPIYLADGHLFGALSINARKTASLTDDDFSMLGIRCKSEAAELKSMLA